MVSFLGVSKHTIQNKNKPTATRHPDLIYLLKTALQGLLLRTTWTPVAYETWVGLGHNQDSPLLWIQG